MLSYLFGYVEGVGEVQAEIRSRDKALVIAVATGKSHDEEGAKTIWRRLSDSERWLVDSRTFEKVNEPVPERQPEPPQAMAFIFHRRAVEG